MQLQAKQVLLATLNTNKQNIENNALFRNTINKEQEYNNFSQVRDNYLSNIHAYEKQLEAAASKKGAIVGGVAGLVISTQTTVPAQIAGSAIATKLAATTGLVATPVAAGAIVVVAGVALGAAAGYGIVKVIEGDIAAKKYSELKTVMDQAKERYDAAEQALNSLGRTQAEYNQLKFNLSILIPRIKIVQQAANQSQLNLNQAEERLGTKNRELQVLRAKTAEALCQLNLNRDISSTSDNSFWTKMVDKKTKKILNKNNNEERINKLAKLDDEQQFRTEIIDKIINQLSEQDRIPFQQAVTERNWWQAKIRAEAGPSQQALASSQQR
ncbi:hypothetical protein [Rickettsiales endosymbiont of Stachyamoeba lipophora]|uniref:hypothetical protein n=1 Tax=Rickettsiales endosymbiont of Stachyamoeba lipophora TaxID=2486578 RepID=UPI000F6544F9|nr:hypothetical protein [Rickettsiales endosymbiont of Stachyamoeba lipophora]